MNQVKSILEALATSGDVEISHSESDNGSDSSETLDKSIIIKAMLDGDVVGELFFDLYQYPGDEKPIAEISMIHTYPNAKRRGIGRKMIEHLLEQFNIDYTTQLFWGQTSKAGEALKQSLNKIYGINERDLDNEMWDIDDEE